MNFYDVLAAKNWSGGIPTINFFDLLFAQSMGGGEQWQTYEGTLPATISANGDDMRQYHVYGATGGVGDRTVQLFDKSTIALYPFKSDGSLFPASTGVGWVHSDYIECQPGETYTAYGMSQGGANTYHCIYDENQTFVRSVLVVANQNAEITFASGEKYIRLSVRDSTAAHEVKTAMFFRGTIPPETYVPYGYKLDMGVSDGTNVTTTPIYIGDDPLEKDEYVDYAEQKVYRRTENKYDISTQFYGQGLNNNGSITNPSLISCRSDFISVTQNTQYTKKSNISDGRSRLTQFFDDGKKFITQESSSKNPTTFTTPDNCAFVRIAYPIDSTQVMLVEGSDATAQYIPYYDPTDPPVALPALPTAEGETVVDYAGQSVAPEKVVFEYKKGI